MKPGKRAPSASPALRGAIGLVGLLVFVELAVAVGLLDLGAIPRPSAIFSETARLLTDPAFLGDVWTTVKGAALGLAIGTAVGITLGALIASSRFADRLLTPIIEVIRPLPGVAVAPLLIAVFQRGLVSRSMTVALACSWPILFNTRAGFGAVDQIATQTARAFGESRLGVLRRVALPWASPFIFTGIRLSAAIAVIVEIAVEILIPDGTGIGGFLALAGSGGVPLETVYGATLVAGLLSLVLNFGLDVTDRRFFGWRKGLGA